MGSHRVKIKWYYYIDGVFENGSKGQRVLWPENNDCGAQNNKIVKYTRGGVSILCRKEHIHNVVLSAPQRYCRTNAFFLDECRYNRTSNNHVLVVIPRAIQYNIVFPLRLCPHTRETRILGLRVSQCAVHRHFSAKIRFRMYVNNKGRWWVRGVDNLTRR